MIRVVPRLAAPLSQKIYFPDIPPLFNRNKSFFRLVGVSATFFSPSACTPAWLRYNIYSFFIGSRCFGINTIFRWASAENQAYPSRFPIPLVLRNFHRIKCCLILVECQCQIQKGKQHHGSCAFPKPQSCINNRMKFSVPPPIDFAAVFFAHMARQNKFPHTARRSPPVPPDDMKAYSE